jgi:enamine deaminase RidA (YjgF/YER057c/UK114 family)
MTDPRHHHKSARMSQVTLHGGLAYFAGQVAEQADGVSVAGQAEQILRKIDHYLREVGSSRSRLLQATIWLADLDDYQAFNTVWDAWIDPQCPPARACVQARLVRPEWLVEIMAVAAL